MFRRNDINISVGFIKRRNKEILSRAFILSFRILSMYMHTLTVFSPSFLSFSFQTAPILFSSNFPNRFLFFFLMVHILHILFWLMVNILMLIFYDSCLVKDGCIYLFSRE